MEEVIYSVLRSKLNVSVNWFFFNPVEEHLLLIHCIKETENFIGLNQLNVKLNLNYILHNIMWYWNCKETVEDK